LRLEDAKSWIKITKSNVSLILWLRNFCTEFENC
jgi:hypothetical protein